jgi:hypothetical protein
MRLSLAAHPDRPSILCAGIIVLDEVLRVDRFPHPDGKTPAHECFEVNGGCAADAAVAVARLAADASRSRWRSEPSRASGMTGRRGRPPAAPPRTGLRLRQNAFST